MVMHKQLLFKSWSKSVVFFAEIIIIPAPNKDVHKSNVRVLILLFAITWHCLTIIFQVLLWGGTNCLEYK